MSVCCPSFAHNSSLSCNCQHNSVFMIISYLP